MDGAIVTTPSGDYNNYNTLDAGYRNYMIMARHLAVNIITIIQ